MGVVHFLLLPKESGQKENKSGAAALRHTALHRRAEASARLSHFVALLPQCTIATLDCALKQQLLPDCSQSNPYDNSNFKPAKRLKFEERGNGAVETYRRFGAAR